MQRAHRLPGGALRRSRGDLVFDIINTLLMAVVALIIFYPLWYVFIASFTDPGVVSAGALVLFPNELYFDGYGRCFSYAPLWTGYLNSVLYTFLGVLISVSVTVTAGYVLSRRDLFGRKVVMFLFAFTMFFGGGMIPSFLVVKSLGLDNTLWALLLPAAVSVYNMIVCRTFFASTIPKEMYEAASIDGCNDFTFYFRIVIPLSSTILAVMALFFGTDRWNAYFDAMIYLRDSAKMPLQIVLRNLLMLDVGFDALLDDPDTISTRLREAQQIKYCVIVLSVVPVMAVYPFLQKYFAKGVMIGSLKG